jgi:septum formation protein
MEETQKNQVSRSQPGDLSEGSQGFTSANVELPSLLLASSSPRRSEILRTVGWPFLARAVEVDESLKPGEAAQEYVERLALTKARAAAARHSNPLILGADTAVVIENEILGKPRDAADAQKMLKTLQGRWHVVVTGIALVSNEGSSERVGHEITEVKFAAMGQDEIAWYVATGEPMDKAGAYAIQGKGARFIERIKGDYFNVMGLPVRLLYHFVKSDGKRKL